MNTRAQKKAFVRLHMPDERGLERLRQEWNLESHPIEAKTLVFWDSFEWGLWFGGYLLFSWNDLYYLADRRKAWPDNILHEEQAQGRRRFWQEFETGPMRTLLKDKLGLRGLAVVAEGLFRQYECDLRNESGKVVCRLQLIAVSTIKPEHVLLQSCQILPLRGYESTALEVMACLTGAGASTCMQNPVELLLHQANNQPRSYTLRPEFGLDLTTPAREATGLIVRVMLKLAVSNLPGVVNDLDTEFLHDYRICLRKIRSVLSLVKGAYPAEGTRQMRTILGDLARQTNRLRDLDVYLLARKDYLAVVPPAFCPALDGMFDDFSTERDKEFHRVASRLAGPVVDRLLHQVSDFFSEQTSHKPSPASDLPVGPLVFAGIYRRYRRIRKIATGIDAMTPDEGIHQLRIECKKLRYLMEFFNELIPAEAGTLLQKLLRRLQGRLGEFNDASVQQKSLLEYWEQRKLGDEVSLGLGGLISSLYQRQQQSRRLIKQSLDEFCSTSTAAVFKHTFKLPAPVFTTDDHRHTDQ